MYNVFLQCSTHKCLKYWCVSCDVCPEHWIQELSTVMSPSRQQGSMGNMYQVDQWLLWRHTDQLTVGQKATHLCKLQGVTVYVHVCVCVCVCVCRLLQLEIVIEDLCSLCSQTLHAPGLCDIICQTTLSIYPIHTLSAWAVIDVWISDTILSYLWHLRPIWESLHYLCAPVFSY